MLYNISDIERVWPNWYKENSDLSFDEQKFVWENTKLPPEDELKLKQAKKQKETQDVSLNRNASGICKNDINPDLKISKTQAIELLSKTTCRTPCKEIASYLEIIFSKWPSKPGHWLYISQTWPPRPIYRVVSFIIKQHRRGDKTIQNAAAYFTYLIKLRKKRKSLRTRTVDTENKQSYEYNKS